MTKRSGGLTANMNGKMFESRIAEILDLNDYDSTAQPENGVNLYGRTIRSDLLFEKNGEPIAIEAKHQGGRGSADEKYPFTVLSIKTGAVYPTIIVYGGGGARPSAIEWMKTQVGGMLIGVFDIVEFDDWLKGCGR